MLPLSELENYKLQVELLQEKLQRSEDNRQQLEKKLDHALQRKLENDKLVKANRLKRYQEFVNEQQSRKERNQQLMAMLEHIDRQTATLSARSERLKALKMQYEMYFAKLIRTQPVRCIQSAPPMPTYAAPTVAAATPIPILLPTTTPTIATTAPLIATPANISTKAMPDIAMRNPGTNMMADLTTGSFTIPSRNRHDSETGTVSNFSNLSGNAVENSIAASKQPQEQYWTLAMATPTPQGMLITSPISPHGNVGVIPPSTINPTTATIVPSIADYLVTRNASSINNNINSSNVDLDCMANYPFGYLPRFLRQESATKMTSNLMPTVTKFANMSTYSDESDELPPTTTTTITGRSTQSKGDNMEDNFSNNKSNNNTNNNSNNNTRENAKNLNDCDFTDVSHDLRTKRQSSVQPPMTTTTTTTSQIHRNDKPNEGELNKNQQQRFSENPMEPLDVAATTTAAAMPSTTRASLLTAPIFDKLPKTLPTTLTTAKYDEPIEASSASSTSFYDYGDDNKDEATQPQAALQQFNQLKLTDEHEREDFNRQGVNALPEISRNLNSKRNDNISSDNAVDASLRQKINENDVNAVSWQQQQQQQQRDPLTQSWQALTTSMPTTTPALITTTSNLNEANDSASFQNQLQTGLTFNNRNEEESFKQNASPPTTTTTTTINQNSIEKIENEIYGELVQPTMEMDATAARTAAQGLVSELVTQQKPQQQQQQQNYTEFDAQNSVIDDANTASNNVTTPSNLTYTETQQQQQSAQLVQSQDALNENGMSQNYDPNYATVEETMANAQNYEQSNADYLQDPNAASYAQYGMDPNDPLQQQQQQDYSNIDYSQYQSTDGSGAYDPNMYPGYTYDPTTGEYKPTADYDAQQQMYETGYGTQEQQQLQQESNYVEQQQYDEQQQQQQQDPNNYAYSEYTPDANAMNYEEMQATPAPAEAESTPSTTDEAPMPTTTTTSSPTAAAAASTKKPTSILSTSNNEKADPAKDNNSQQQKKKKRVNFVDSSETEDSLSLKSPTVGDNPATAAQGGGGGGGGESDFDFSSSDK